MTAINKLINEIKAPKSKWNSFGKYNYRSNEDIQTALKPLLLKYDLKLVSDSKLIEVAGLPAVSVSLALYDSENNQVATGAGQALVDVNKKGMDKPQATGGAMSYASKYAFGQMLLLDDTSDNDATNNGNDTQQKKEQPKKVYTMTLTELKEKVAKGEMTQDEGNALYKAGKVDKTK